MKDRPIGKHRAIEKDRPIGPDQFQKLEQEVKLIALDLDGTLFDSNGRISAKNQEIIRQATSQDIEVMISTGRPLSGVPKDTVLPLGVNYALTTNGAAVYDLRTGDCVYEKTIEPAMILEIIERLLTFDVYFDVFMDGQGYAAAQNRAMVPSLSAPDSIKEYILKTRDFRDDLVGFLRESPRVQKITIDFYKNSEDVLVDRAETKAMLEEYEDISLVSGGYDNLEINQKGTAKGNTLRIFAEQMGIPMEATMAIGDTENDLNIVETARIGIAMDNAEDCLKEVAQYVTTSNDEDGVGYAIERLVLGE